MLHSISALSMKSTFPVAVGANITGVDAQTYGIQGEAFSTIALPEQSSETATLLQKDPVDLAYEFARKFPGYTGDNLMEKGIHEVQARKFCL